MTVDTQNTTSTRNAGNGARIAWHPHNPAMDPENMVCAPALTVGIARTLVLEAIAAFEQVNQRKLDYRIGERRLGDVIAIYANKDKAERELQWKPRYSLEDIMLTAWKWEQEIQQETRTFPLKNFKFN